MIRQAWRLGGIRAEARLAEALFFMGKREQGRTCRMPLQGKRQRPSSRPASRGSKRGCGCP
ncbi:hypothetical protein VE23_03355 [Paenibacillus sp. D9]|nr:hypothetical protein VE23_03355 [Paenibacillus sp. D9]